MSKLHFPDIESETFGDQEYEPESAELLVAPEKPRPPRLFMSTGVSTHESAYLDEPEVKRLVKYLNKWLAGVHGSTVEAPRAKRAAT